MEPRDIYYSVEHGLVAIVAVSNYCGVDFVGDGKDSVAKTAVTYQHSTGVFTEPATDFKAKFFKWGKADMSPPTEALQCSQFRVYASVRASLRVPVSVGIFLPQFGCGLLISQLVYKDSLLFMGRIGLETELKKQFPKTALEICAYADGAEWAVTEKFFLPK